MGDTAAVPSDNDCIKSGAARAYRAHLELARLLSTTAPFARPVTHCVNCARITGNWCDGCEDAGRHFRGRVILENSNLLVLLDNDLRGSPLCTTCEDTLGVCRVCTPDDPLFAA